MIKALFGRNFILFCIVDFSDLSETCSEYFSRRLELNSEFWKELDVRHPECMCEKVSVSKYSPDPVSNSEILVSVVTNRSYVTSDGKLSPTLFDNRIKNGISADRKKVTTKIDYDLRSNKIVENGVNKVNCGSIALSVARIRAIKHNGKRAFGVYDTAFKENISHAEIASTNIPPPGTTDRSKIRAELRRGLLRSVLYNCRVLNSTEIFE